MNAPAAPSESSSYLELKTWHLHTTPENQGQRVSEFLSDGLAPALSRTGGAKLVGAFSVVIGPGSPSYITLVEYNNLAAMQDAIDKMRSDSAYQQAVQTLSNGPGLPFVRIESKLMRSFDNVPRVRIPEDAAGRKPRIFEMRTYENQSLKALEHKIHMFESGETAIFERLKMRPVFFGETIIGSLQPNLTYMLSFDSLAERDRLWGEFGNDPAWKKLRSEPGNADSEIVSNISNLILSPLAFSEIR